MEEKKNSIREKESFIPQKLFNALFNNMKGIQYRIDLSNHLAEFSGTNLLELTGYNQEEFSSQKIEWGALIHKEDLELVTSKREKIISEEDYVADSEYRIISKNGDTKWIRDIAILNNEEGECRVFIQGVVFDITQSKNTEEIINSYKTHYRQTVENSPNPIFTIDKEGLIVSWNTASINIFKYENEDIIGKHYSVLLLNKNDAITIEDRLTLIEQGEVFKNVDLVYRSKQGSKCYCITRIYPYRDPNGKIIGAVFANTDITDRKGIQQALHLSESKFSQIFQISPDPIYISRIHDGIFININKGFSTLTGYAPEEVLTSSTKDIILWNDVEEKAKFIKRLLINGEVNNIETSIRHKNGIIKTCLVSARIIDIDDDKCSLIILKDITERNFVNALLKESEESFRKLFEESADPVLLMDKDMFLDCNKATIDILGFEDKTQIVGKTPWDISPEKQPDGLDSQSKAKEMLDFVAQNGFHKFEWEHKKRNGSRLFFEVMITQINLKGKKLFYVVMRDITDRKLTEHELIKAKEKAEMSEQLKSAFLAQMSHEIRSPLYRILGYITLIKDYVVSTGLNNDESEEFFYRIDLSGKRLIRTIDSILNMSELQTQSYSPVFSRHDLFSIVENVYKEYQMEARLKEIGLILNKATENTYLLCDEYSVSQIFANLIDNALKYTKVGKVKIVLGRNANNNLFVDVSDTGIGMSEDFKAKLFKPFSQEETGYTRKFEGNGLGLALVKNYCQINNASIEVKSEKWKGTSFKIVFS